MPEPMAAGALIPNSPYSIVLSSHGTTAGAFYASAPLQQLSAREGLGRSIR